jgi:hypothetical protein
MAGQNSSCCESLNAGSKTYTSNMSVRVCAVLLHANGPIDSTWKSILSHVVCV